MKNYWPVRIIDFRGTYKSGGGPDKTILNSAARHNGVLVNVLVVYLRQPKDDEFAIDKMAKVLGIQYIDFVDKKLMDLKCLWNLYKLIKSFRCEVMHTHDDKTLLYGALLKIVYPKLILMHTCHSHSEYRMNELKNIFSYWWFLLRKKIQIFLMKQNCKPLLTISEDTRNRLIRGGFKNSEIVVLHNGVDVEFWQRKYGRPILREENDIADNCFVVGTVARIAFDKDFPTFFQVASTITKAISNVLFFIVGDGDGKDLENTKRVAVEKGVSGKIIFVGHRTDLRDIYSSFDIFLMTSRTEGLPNTVLEAMAMEVPVVSTDVGGLSELIVSGETGFLCPVYDAPALAGKIIELKTNLLLRKKIAKSARAFVVDKFSFEKRVKCMERYYQFFVGRTDGKV